MGTDAPRLTIGVPVFNGGKFLAETLNSLLGQSFGDFELIVSDNASTDETEEIGRAFVEMDRRVRYHRNPVNLGLSMNYNGLFAMARGELFKWATADDVCLPRYVEKCVEALDRDPAVVLAYPKTRFIDSTGLEQPIEDRGWNLMMDQAHERLRYVVYAGHWVNSILGVIRSRSLARTGLLPTYPGGDYCLLGELCLQGKFFEVPEYLYQRRIHPAASSQKARDERWIAEYWKGQDRTMTLPAWSRSLDHFRTTVRSDLGVSCKLSLFASILRSMVRRRGRLWHEAQVAVQAPFRRRSVLNQQS